MKKGAPSVQCFKLDQTFFGFKPQDRVALHSTLFDLVWQGEGRWSWETVYNLPVNTRKFWINKINDKLTPTEPTTNVTKDLPQMPTVSKSKK